MTAKQKKILTTPNYGTYNANHSHSWDLASSNILNV